MASPKVELMAYLCQTPGLEGVAERDVTFSRLGGTSNDNFLVDTGRGKYVLRLPGSSSHHFVDRKAERHNARSAESRGLTAPILYQNANGVQVTGYLEGYAPLTSSDFASSATLDRVAMAFRRLHRQTANDGESLFANRLNPLDTLTQYRVMLCTLETPEYAALSQLGDDLLRLRKRYDAFPQVPCHGDPVGGNLMDNGKQILFIDWEYAGMGDPLWDLAVLSLEEGLSSRQTDLLLRLYAQEEPSKSMRLRFNFQKTVSAVLFAYWGYIRKQLGDDSLDYEKYAEDRLTTAQNLWRQHANSWEYLK